jgi:hypothetical protein
MAKSTNTAADAAAAEKGGTPDTAKQAAESLYSAAELSAAARARFGVPPEVVTAAMRMAGKKSATLSDAKEIITKFSKREVK